MTKSILGRVLVGLMASLLLVTAAWADVITYYHNDLLGSPRVATDQSGQVVWTESYSPHGERRNPQLVANKIWYTSRHQDDDTGLVYMGARYYDPVTGRFMGIDPKTFDPINIHSFNRYAYANNNPYGYTDRDGKMADKVIFVVGAFAILAYGGSIYLSDPRNQQRILDGIRSFQNTLNENTSEADKSEKKPKSSDPKGGQDERKRSNPLDGEPGSCTSCKNQKGDKKQDRHYGSDGWPDLDIDHDHDHKDDNGQRVGKPHAHVWGRPSDGGPPRDADRGPGIPLVPELP